MQLTDPFGLAAVAARLGGTASLSSYEIPTYNPATLPRLAPSVANAPRAASTNISPELLAYLTNVASGEGGIQVTDFVRPGETTIQAGALIDIGRRIESGEEFGGGWKYVPREHDAYINLGRKLAREEATLMFRAGGYYDEFGWHSSFCMSCHGWNENDRLKYAAASNGLNNSWEFFAVQTTADLLLTGALSGAPVAATRQATSQSLRAVQLTGQAQRTAVLGRIAESQAARQSSGFGQFLRAERQVLQSTGLARPAQLPLVQPVNRAVTWVDEAASMSSEAWQYSSGAAGARSNVLTRKSQVPAILSESGGYVRFDGELPDLLIDRKLAVVTSPKAQNQALRQAAALRHNELRGVWEVPTPAQAARARAMFDKLRIDNINAAVVPK